MKAKTLMNLAWAMADMVPGFRADYLMESLKEDDRFGPTLHALETLKRWTEMGIHRAYELLGQKRRLPPMVPCPACGQESLMVYSYQLGNVNAELRWDADDFRYEEGGEPSDIVVGCNACLTEYDLDELEERRKDEFASDPDAD